MAIVLSSPSEFWPCTPHRPRTADRKAALPPPRRIAEKSTFCRNPYNYNGLCNRSSCPLANSQYATIREHKGKVFLYMKTVERAHLPAKLWEKVKLSRNYTKALEQVGKHLEFWPQLMVRVVGSTGVCRVPLRVLQVHRNKQRLTKIYQYLLRVRRIEADSTAETRVERVKNSLKRSLESREAKALKAADLERSIEKELLERLKSGTYGDIYNFPEAQYEKALDAAEGDFSKAHPEEEEEADDEDVGVSEFVADLDDDDDEDPDQEFDEDDEDDEDDDLEDVGRAFASSSAGRFAPDDDEDEEDDDESDEQEEDPVPVARSKRGRAAEEDEPASKRVRPVASASASASSALRRKPKRAARGPRVEIEYEDESSARAPVAETHSEW
jgi:protein MAK16